ncbi:DUF5710 domain-containing protein [Konateibacter massiliensis]|uniref:DUF5710 domain-containing protein n=1 Tax=Konateibacter massiliensis TaxID=2002841 RepID=UPI000C15C366|nr:DUF5710 domain-containing protein [Konateibacter massiliensis]
MMIRLNVPYQEKDMAKSKGAKWNPDIKTWYVDDIANLAGLAKWVNSYNIVCENIYILKMERICWKCKKSSDVVCLATDKSYSTESGYKINSDIQLLSYVLEMPDLLANYMKEQFSYFPSYSRTINSTYYINHCKHCNSIQGDNFLHEVPAEAFYGKLCYKNSERINYAKLKNQFSIPIQADLPYYDEVSSSMEMMMLHMETEIENRASLNITQGLINKLFSVSNPQPDISINGV